MTKPVYSTLVDALLYDSNTAGFTELDWLKLAQAAVDQSGASIEVQDKVADILSVEALKSDGVTLPLWMEE